MKFESCLKSPARSAAAPDALAHRPALGSGPLRRQLAVVEDDEADARLEEQLVVRSAGDSEVGQTQKRRRRSSPASAPLRGSRASEGSINAHSSPACAAARSAARTTERFHGGWWRRSSNSTKQPNGCVCGFVWPLTRAGRDHRVPWVFMEISVYTFFSLATAILGICTALLLLALFSAGRWREYNYFGGVASSSIFAAMEALHTEPLSGRAETAASRVQLICAGVHVACWAAYAAADLGPLKRWQQRVLEWGAIALGLLLATSPGIFDGQIRTMTIPAIGYSYRAADLTPVGIVLPACSASGWCWSVRDI